MWWRFSGINIGEYDSNNNLTLQTCFIRIYAFHSHVHQNIHNYGSKTQTKYFVNVSC